MTQNTHDLLALIDRLSRFFFIARKFGNALHRDADISTGQRSVLMEVAQSDGRNVSQMAARRGISKQAVQKMVDSLAARGLVRKITPPSDRRNRIIEITAEGRALLGSLATIEMQEVSTFLNTLPDTNLGEINALLDALEGALNTRSTELAR